MEKIQKITNYVSEKKLQTILSFMNGNLICNRISK